MTISTDHVQDIFDGNGGRRYSVDWQVRRIGGKTEISVWKIDSKGAETPLVEGVDFTVVIDRLGEGATIFLANDLAAGDKLRVLSARPYTQESHFPPGCSVDPVQLEGNLDDNVIQHLQLWTALKGKVNAAYDALKGQYANIVMHPMKDQHLMIYTVGKNPGDPDNIVDSGYSMSQIPTDKWIKAPTDKDWVLVSQANPDSPTGFAYVPNSINRFATDSWINAPGQDKVVLVSGPSMSSFTGFQYNEVPLLGFITTATFQQPTAPAQVPVSVASAGSPTGFQYQNTPLSSFITVSELKPATQAGQILTSVPDPSSFTGFAFKPGPEQFSWLKPPTDQDKTIVSVPDATSPTGFSYQETLNAKSRLLDSTGILRGLQVSDGGYDTVEIKSGLGIIADTDGKVSEVDVKNDIALQVPVTTDGNRYIYIDENGDAKVQNRYPRPDELYNKIWIGTAKVINGELKDVSPFRLENRNVLASMRELLYLDGPWTDCVLSTSSPAGFQHSGGIFVRYGVEQNSATPAAHVIEISGSSAEQFRFVYSDGTGTAWQTAFDGSLLPAEDISIGSKTDIPSGQWGAYPILMTPEGRLELMASRGSSTSPAGLQKIIDEWRTGDEFKLNAYMGFIGLKSGIGPSSFNADHILVIHNKLTGGRLAAPSTSVKGAAEGITDANSVISGMVMSIDPSGQTISITPGQAMFIDPADLKAGPSIVDVPAQTSLAIPRIADTDYSFIYAHKDGSYTVEQNYKNTARGNDLLLGVVEHTGNTRLQFVRHLALNSDAFPKQIYDLYGMVGNKLVGAYIEKSALNTDGFVTFDGVFKGFGVNPANRLDYSEIDIKGADAAPFYTRKLDGTQVGPLTAFKADTITTLDDGSNIPSGHYCYIPIFEYPDGKLYLQYPQSESALGALEPLETWYGKYKVESGLQVNGALRAVIKYHAGTDLSDTDNEILLVSDKAFTSALPGGGGTSPLPIPNPDGSDLNKVPAVGPGNAYALVPQNVLQPSAADKILVSKTDSASSTGFSYKEADKFAVGGVAPPSAADKVLISKPDASSPTGFAYKEADKSSFSGPKTYWRSRVASSIITGSTGLTDFGKKENMYVLADAFASVCGSTVIVLFESTGTPSGIVSNTELTKLLGKKYGTGPSADADNFTVTFSGGGSLKVTVKETIINNPLVKECYFMLNKLPADSPGILTSAQGDKQLYGLFDNNRRALGSSTMDNFMCLYCENEWSVLASETTIEDYQWEMEVYKASPLNIAVYAERDITSAGFQYIEIREGGIWANANTPKKNSPTSYEPFDAMRVLAEGSTKISFAGSPKLEMTRVWGFGRGSSGFDMVPSRDMSAYTKRLKDFPDVLSRRASVNTNYPWGLIFKTFDEAFSQLQNSVAAMAIIECELSGYAGGTVKFASSLPSLVGKKYGIGPLADADNFTLTEGAASLKVTVKKVFTQANFVEDFYLILSQIPTGSNDPPTVQANGSQVLALFSAAAGAADMLYFQQHFCPEIKLKDGATWDTSPSSSGNQASPLLLMEPNSESGGYLSGTAGGDVIFKDASGTWKKDQVMSGELRMGGLQLITKIASVPADPQIFQSLITFSKVKVAAGTGTYNASILTSSLFNL